MATTRVPTRSALDQSASLRPQSGRPANERRRGSFDEAGDVSGPQVLGEHDDVRAAGQFVCPDESPSQDRTQHEESMVRFSLTSSSAYARAGKRGGTLAV